LAGARLDADAVRSPQRRAAPHRADRPRDHRPANGVTHDPHLRWQPVAVRPPIGRDHRGPQLWRGERARTPTTPPDTDSLLSQDVVLARDRRRCRRSPEYATPGQGFVLSAPPAGVDAVPQLQSPADGETLCRPTFRWARLSRSAIPPEVSTNNTSLYYDLVSTPIRATRPSAADTYANGTTTEGRSAQWQRYADRYERRTSLSKARCRLAGNQQDHPSGTPAFSWNLSSGAYRLRVSTQATWQHL
jgi:hypothetical protein